jgi:serine/threonine protein kinase
MGEVYLALDTKLKRKVALKVLRAEVASRPDRLDRSVADLSDRSETPIT